MDIIVRGVRTGLPLGDCLKIIAHESPAPLGTEFRRVVEGESLGIPLEVCLEQMYERMPISEAIVVGGLVTVMSPDYMAELYTTPTGHRNMMIGAGLMVLGTVMMRKMINFKF